MLSRGHAADESSCDAARGKWDARSRSSATARGNSRNCPKSDNLPSPRLRRDKEGERDQANTLAICAIFVAVFGISIDVEAQVAGTISGFVRDESGAVIPGADVSATMIGQQ